MYNTDAEVKVKNSQGAVIATGKYQKVVFEGTSADGNGKPVHTGPPEELLSQAINHFQGLNPKGNGLIDLLENVTYAYDLGQRAKVRAQLVAAAAGPDKAIDKMVKDFMAGRAAAGKPVTEEVARAKVLAMMAD
jgi:hypothetical protein